MFTFTTAGRLVGTASAVALLLLGSGISAAQNAKPKPRFTFATAALDPQDFDYVATWTETGLGKGSVEVVYQLVSKNPSSRWQCIGPNFQPRGEEQPGATEEEVNEQSLKTENGTIKGMLPLRLGPGNVRCNGQGFLCHTFVSYAGNTITDTSNGVSAVLPDMSMQIPLPTDDSELAGNCFPTH